MKVLTKKIKYNKGMLEAYLNGDKIDLALAINKDDLPPPYDNHRFRTDSYTRLKFHKYLDNILRNKKNYVYVKDVRINSERLRDLVVCSSPDAIATSIAIKDGHLSPAAYSTKHKINKLQAYSVYLYGLNIDFDVDSGVESVKVSWYEDYWEGRSAVKEILTPSEPTTIGVLWEGFA